MPRLVKLLCLLAAMVHLERKGRGDEVTWLCTA